MHRAEWVKGLNKATRIHPMETTKFHDDLFDLHFSRDQPTDPTFPSLEPLMEQKIGNSLAKFHGVTMQ